jgi:hypothetical protein
MAARKYSMALIGVAVNMASMQCLMKMANIIEEKINEIDRREEANRKIEEMK